MLARRYGIPAAIIFACWAGLGFVSSRERILLANTFYFTLAVELIALPIAMAAAWLFERTEFPGRRFLTLAAWSLPLMPLYLVLCGWEAAFGRLGWYTVSYGEVARPLLSSWQAAIWIHAVYAIPWGTVIIAAALRNADTRREDAVRMEGGAFALWRYAVLPQAAPGIAAAAIVIAIMTAGEMTVTNIYLVRTFAEEIYGVLAGTGAGDALFPALFTITCAVLPCSLLLFTVVDRYPIAREGDGRCTRSRLGFVGTSLVWMFLSLLIFVPFASLVQRAGATVRLVDGSPMREWSVSQLVLVLRETPLRFAGEFAASFEIAAIVTPLAVLLAIGPAWLFRRSGLSRQLLRLFAAFLLAIPAPLCGMFVIRFFQVSQVEWFVFLYDRTTAPVCLALLLRCVPLLTLWFSLRFAVFPASLLETAAVEGAVGLRRFIRIVIPMSLSTIAGGALIAAAVALGDLAVGILTLPPGVSTIPHRMFGLVHSGVEEQVAGIGIFVWIFHSLLAVLIVKFLHRRDTTFPG